MNKGKPSFLLYRSFYEPIKSLNNTQLGELFRAIYEYQIDGSTPAPSSKINMAFQFFRNQFELDESKYQTKCEKNAENVKKRWNKSNTNEYDRKQTNTKRTYKDKEKEKEKEKDNDNEKVIYPFPSERFSEGWKYWIEFKRIQFKFKYASSTSEQTALKSLQNLSGNDEQMALKIIEQSVSNGWKGLFAVKGNIGKNGIDTDHLQELKDRLS